MGGGFDVPDGTNALSPGKMTADWSDFSDQYPGVTQHQKNYTLTLLFWLWYDLDALQCAKYEKRNNIP